MRFLTFIVCYCLGVSCLSAIAHAQTPRSQSSDVIRQLLSMPAPPPRSSATDAEAREKRPPQFYDKNNVPRDDAPTRDLVDYWGDWGSSSNSDMPMPSATTVRRLLEACAAEPAMLSKFLPLLPRTQASTEPVKRIYDEAHADEHLDKGWHEAVRKWLLFNSKYFLGDLLALASRAKDDESGYVHNEEALESLVRVDWPTAEPLLHRLAGGSQPRSAALAIALLYSNARDSKDAGAEEQYRVQLRGVAADRNSPGRARDTAIGALSRTEWTGRDEWYLTLFSDETLLQPRDGNTMSSPLTTVFNRNPDKWIPVMTGLVESKNRAIQQAAASCLVRYTTRYAHEDARRDAILPVLRWLSDPGWLPISGTERSRFIQKMADLEVPESIPGLIWIVENETSTRIWAASTLAHYKDPRAIPALKKALARENNEDHRRYILEGLLASGGLPQEEQLDALWSYAEKLLTPGGRKEVEEYRSYGDGPLPLPVSIGKYLARKKEVPESLVTAVLDLAENRRKSNPAQAQALLTLTHGWQTRQVDLDVIRRIGKGAADAATIAHALEQRAKLRESVASEVQALAGAGGSPQGIAAVLLDDQNLAYSILGSGVRPAQASLLACARLIQMPLSLNQVSALMRTQDPLLTFAAERYLLAEDSKDAQRLLLERHPEEAFITGWRENNRLFNGGNLDAMDRLENALRAELSKENPPLEIFALIPNDEDVGPVLRVYRDSAVYTRYEGPARYSDRVVSDGELARFRSFMAEHNLAEIGPQLGECHFCVTTEFLALTKESGRRIFSHQWAAPDFLANLEMLGRGDGVKVHYRLEDKIKGLEVLHTDRTLPARDVWQRGDDIRILVEREESPEVTDTERTDDPDEDAEAARTERVRKENARLKARFSWRDFSSLKVGVTTTQPEPFSPFDESKFEIDDRAFPSYRRSTQPISGNLVVLANNSGLWKKIGQQKAIRISGEGQYADPAVTPDGRWAVALKTDGHWGRSIYVVRINLQTGREYRANVQSADGFDVVGYVAAHGRVLLRRDRDEGSSRGAAGRQAFEYYLLDAATGAVRLIQGVFAPLGEGGRRSLQPANSLDEVWAAIPDHSTNQTQVGRYNLKTFTFKPLLVVPHITFESRSMWIDEAAAKVYLVYEGQLLRLPLSGAR